LNYRACPNGFAVPAFLVSELLEGEPLRVVLDRDPLPQRNAIDYAAQIATGLAVAHDKDIVHRDLKPDNLFICRDDRFQILDFVLAKLATTHCSYRRSDQSKPVRPRCAIGGEMFFYVPVSMTQVPNVILPT
jgi:serine/threonine protein kinase